MKNPPIALFCGLFLAALTSCVAQPQTPVRYDAYGYGSSTHSRAFGEWTLTLSRAELAVGPVYFCTSASSSMDSCSSALQELRTCAAIDALSDAPQALGDIAGVTGSIRSAKYDLGLSWLLTDSRARPSEAAPGGHSLVVEGTATHADSRTFSFLAEIDLSPQFAGSYAIDNQSMSASIDDDDARLEVRVDALDWFEGMDFEALAATSDSLTPVVIRDGYPRLEDGTLDPRSRAREVLAQGLTNRSRPMFTWSASENPQ